MEKVTKKILSTVISIAMLASEAATVLADGNVIITPIDEEQTTIAEEQKEDKNEEEQNQEESIDEIEVRREEEPEEDTGISLMSITSSVTSLNAESAAETIVGSGIEIENATYSGGTGQIGKFTVNTAMGLPFEEGVVMSTGYAASAFGASSYGSMSTSTLSWLTDMYHASGYSGSTNQAAVLKFSLTPTSPYLSFDYFFASKEYDQSAQYNDLFGLWVIDDMGTATTSDDEKFNIALLPNNKIVSIQTTVPRSSTGGMAYTQNGDYYRYSGGSSLNGYTFPFLGYTIQLTADASNIRNSKNELVIQTGKKISLCFAIADASDTAVDSAVFIKANSLSYASKHQNISFQSSVRTTREGSIDETTYVSPEKVFGTASGVTYKWYQSTDGTNYSAISASENVFSIPTDLTAGTYYYKCVLNNGTQSVTSGIQKIVVLPSASTTAIHTVMFKHLSSQSLVEKIPNSFTVADGQKLPKLEEPTNKYCTFGGWCTDSACTKAFNTDSAINSDKVVEDSPKHRNL